MKAMKSSSLARDSKESGPLRGKNRLLVNDLSVFAIASMTDLNLGHKWKEFAWNAKSPLSAGISNSK